MTVTDAPVSVEKPRTPSRPAARRNNFELYSWLFMRLSGVVLLFLVLGHILIMLFVDGGVQRINFAFVAGRFADQRQGVRFGHAGAIVEGSKGSPAAKIEALRAAGVLVADKLYQIPDLVRNSIIRQSAR